MTYLKDAREGLVSENNSSFSLSWVVLA